MRSLAIVAATATLISSTTGKYLTQNSAQALATGFGKLISAYTMADAEALLADNLVDYSDSINSLIGQPVGQATFPSKAAFEIS